jgi:hypothetical protein
MQTATVNTGLPAPKKLRLAERASNAIESTPSGARLLYIILSSVTVNDLRIMERLLSLFTITAGLWMGWPIENQYKSHNPIYKAMIDHFPSWGWTILFLTCGIPSMLGCSPERRYLKAFCVSPRCRRYAAGASMWLWGFLAIIFYIDQSPGLSTVWAPILTIYNLWIFLWLGVKFPRDADQCNH